jgi:hypothetical protein
MPADDTKSLACERREAEVDEDEDESALSHEIQSTSK